MDIKKLRSETYDVFLKYAAKKMERKVLRALTDETVDQLINIHAGALCDQVKYILMIHYKYLTLHIF